MYVQLLAGKGFIMIIGTAAFFNIAQESFLFFWSCQPVAHFTFSEASSCHQFPVFGISGCSEIKVILIFVSDSETENKNIDQKLSVPSRFSL